MTISEHIISSVLIAAVFVIFISVAAVMAGAV